MKMFHTEAVLFIVVLSNHLHWTTGFTCPEGEIKHNIHCYKFGTETLTFDDAKAFCEKDGKILAEITNKVEDDFLRSKADADTGHYGYWIGAKGINGIFKWVGTDTTMTYTNWAFEEPILKTGCVYLFKGKAKWTVTSCANGFSRPICESKKKVRGV